MNIKTVVLFRLVCYEVGFYSKEFSWLHHEVIPRGKDLILYLEHGFDETYSHDFFKRRREFQNGDYKIIRRKSKHCVVGSICLCERKVLAVAQVLFILFVA